MLKIVVALLLCSGMAFGQLKQVTIEFVKDGETVNVSDESFNVYVVTIGQELKTVFKPTLSGKNFLMPDLCGVAKGHLLIAYDGEVYDFGYHNLNFDQNMRLKIGLDKRPYDKEYYLKEAEPKEVRAIAYVEFYPLENGKGKVTTKSIKDFKAYLLASKDLIE